MSSDKDKIYGGFVNSHVFYNIIKSLSNNISAARASYCNMPAGVLSDTDSPDSDKKKNKNSFGEDDAQKLNIAFIAFYGSRNYGLQSPESDYDFFIVYYPNFHNFFNNKFIRYSVIEANYDYFITPFHEFIHHAMNGNVKFIEPLICGSIYFPDELNLIFKNNAVFQEKNIQTIFRSSDSLLSNLLEEVNQFILLNYEKNFNSFIGLANNKRLNIAKDNYTSNTIVCKDIYGYDIKEAINALRIIFLAQNYLSSGKIDFFVKNNDAYIEFEKICIDIKNKIISKKDILQLLESMIKNINHQADKYAAFSANNNNKSYFIGTESINKDTDNFGFRREELEADIQKKIENICKKNL
jgi:predicted nucleotidyltransferase